MGTVRDTKRARLPVCATGVSMLAIMTLLCSCSPSSEEDDSDECRANIECPGAAVCVAGSCIEDAAECRTLGALVSVSRAIPQNAEAIGEMHVTVESGGRVHYCYQGTLKDEWVSYYGKQVGPDVFEEEALEVNGELLSCSAIQIADDGTPYVFSRSPLTVAHRAKDETWVTPSLTGLESADAQNSFAGMNNISILTPSKNNGVYLGLSMGFDLTAQSLYVARVDAESVQVLVNGFEQTTVEGYAPQALPVADNANVVFEVIPGFKVLLMDAGHQIIDEVEGAYPRAARSPDGSARVAFMDFYGKLNLASVESGVFGPPMEVSPVQVKTTGMDKRRIPWEMAVDGAGAAHLLFEDKSQGASTLVYRSVDIAGHTSEPRIVTSDLSQSMLGSQRYAIGVDICNRPTFAVMIDDATGDAGVDLPIIETMEIQ